MENTVSSATHHAVLTSIFNLNMGFTLSVYEISCDSLLSLFLHLTFISHIQNATFKSEDYANAIPMEDIDAYTKACETVVERWQEEITPLLVRNLTGTSFQNMQIYLYQTMKSDSMEYFAKIGVNAIIGNFPDLAEKALNPYR